jgi:putative FmdB family regulatory protein
MPLYGFICQDCHEEFEELVSISKLDDVTCPECSSNSVERQLSLVASMKTSGSGSVASSSAACSTGGG